MISDREFLSLGNVSSHNNVRACVANRWILNSLHFRFGHLMKIWSLASSMSGLEIKLNVANGYLDIRMKWDFMITANNHSEWKHYFECNVVNVIKLQGYYYIFMNAPNVIMEMMVKHGFVALSYMEIFSWLL